MVAYDFSAEPNNPWDAATWNPRAQIDFTRRMRTQFNFNGSAEPRILQRISQSDTKGVPPPAVKKVPPYQVIIQKRFLMPSTKNITLGFGMSGLVAALTKWTLPVVTTRVQFPSSTPSDARCDVAPTGDSTFALLTSNFVLLCTVTFPAEQTIGTFNWSVPPGYIAQPGDLLYLVAADPQDATLAGVNIAFLGTELLP